MPVAPRWRGTAAENRKKMEKSSRHMESLVRHLPTNSPGQRLLGIDLARRAVLRDRCEPEPGWLAPWVERSWQRCLTLGLKPHAPVTFDVITPAQARRAFDANQQLAHSARPILEGLGRAIVNTRYFAILTNTQGVVVDASGVIDRSDPLANLITRIGADLSERGVGTTAIGMALSELQPVWLHRGEHFFEATSVYSCAGAPLFGPDGACVGMLDVTGINAVERPELKHLVIQSASKIENALVLALPHALVLRLNWPGNHMGSNADGLICLNKDGLITGANGIARQMVPGLIHRGKTVLHISEVLGVSCGLLFDSARNDHAVLEIPLWTGLRLNVLCVAGADENQGLPATPHRRPGAGLSLKDLEMALIRKAVQSARGNVAEAARALGIGRATVYRKLGQKPRPD